MCVWEANSERKRRVYIFARARVRERVVVVVVGDLLLLGTDHYGAAEARRDGGHDERAEDHAQRRLPARAVNACLCFSRSLV
jgi:hypothetical protein